MPGSLDGRSPSNVSGSLYRRLDRHFPISEMASAARSHNPLRHHGTGDHSHESHHSISSSTGSLTGSVGVPNAAPGAGEGGTRTSAHSKHSSSTTTANPQNPCPTQGVLRHPGQPRRPTSRRRRPSFAGSSGSGQRRLNAVAFDLPDTVAATSAAAAAAADVAANTALAPVRVPGAAADIRHQRHGAFQHDTTHDVPPSAPGDPAHLDPRRDQAHFPQQSRYRETTTQNPARDDCEIRERRSYDLRHSDGQTRMTHQNGSSSASGHARAPSLEYRAFEAEAFRLGRPGEFEGRYGTEHIAHPPRLAPLELPHASPGLCYSRTMRYSAYAPSNLAQAMQQQVWLRFVDDRDKQVALELRPPGATSTARRERMERGIPTSLHGSHEELAALTDSYGNALLKLHGRFVDTDPYANVSHAQNRHSRNNRPTLREVASRTSTSLFVIVISNEWNEALFTVTIPPHCRLEPVEMNGGNAVMKAYSDANCGHARTSPRNLHSITSAPVNVPRSNHLPPGIPTQQFPVSSNGVSQRPYIDEDIAYARRIAAHNAASCFEEVPMYDGYDLPPNARAAFQAGSLPDEIHRGISTMSISSGASGGSGHSGRSTSRNSHSAHDPHAALRSARVDTFEDEDLFDPLSVDAFYGELNAPNRPMGAAPLIRLVPSEDISQDIVLDEKAHELAVVTHAPDEDRRVQVPMFSLLLHPGVDVTIVAALIAARVWLEEHDY